MNVRSFRKAEKEQFNELKEKRLDSRFTGSIFSAIHGKLVTELFNKETKGTSGLFR